jgi:hypothetical protein
MRPRFEVLAPYEPLETQQRLRTMLDQEDCSFTGLFLDRHLRVRIPESQRHFWTPQLDVEIEPHPDGSLLRALFTPPPDVWTFFIATYAVMTFCGLTGLLFGLVQWWLGWPPWALWSVPIAALMIGSVYVVALIGQRLAYDQMVQLRTFLEGIAS